MLLCCKIYSGNCFLRGIYIKKYSILESDYLKNHILKDESAWGLRSAGDALFCFLPMSEQGRVWRMHKATLLIVVCLPPNGVEVGQGGGKSGTVQAHWQSQSGVPAGAPTQPQPHCFPFPHRLVRVSSACPTMMATPGSVGTRPFGLLLPDSEIPFLPREAHLATSLMVFCQQTLF